MDSNKLYQLYLQRLLQQQQAEQGGGSIDKMKGYVSKVNDYGNKLSVVGDAIKDNINNEVAKKIGTSMSNVGGAMQNGANTATNILDKPANYFKGFAGNSLQNIGAKLGTQGGALGTLGNGISSLGTTVAGGTGAGAATGAAAAGSAGTAAGTAGTVGGLTTAGTTGAAAGSGAAAGGAAAGGGSAAGGAAAAGPIGALIALGAMAVAGANRKRAKKSGEALMQSTNQMSEQGNEESDQRLALTQQNAAAQQEQAQKELLNGIMTGGAAQIQDVDGNVSDFPTTKEAFAKSLRDNGWDDLGVNSALNGLNNGNKEMSDYINYYNTVAQDGQQIAIPKTEDEIAKARALASGQEANAQTGNVQRNEQIKRGLFDKFVSGIGDLTRGYEENRNNAFAPTNLQEKSFTTDNGQTIDKGGMARIGEAMGTIGRMVNKPAVQALVAGGLSTALTGNPLYGLGMASKFGGQRAMSNIYQDALAKQGIEANPGMFGAITSTDMNALMMPQYKEQANAILKARIDEQQRYHDLMMQYYQDKLKETHENNVKNQEIKQTNANANVIRANNSGKKGGGSGKTTQPKPQDHKDWNSDLAGFTQIMTDPRYVDKAGEAKARFIQKYGVDPMKYVKL